MAVHADDVLEAAQVVESIPEALTGCDRAIATAVRSRSESIPLEHPRTVLPDLVDTSAALIFGAEERGLSNDELKYAQRLVYIPASSEYVSLNLAQAVAVCCYELHQSLMVSEVAIAQNSSASLDVLEGYYQHLETVLLKIGFLQPQTAPSRMEKFRRLFNRSQLSHEEVTMLRGILRQMEWATSHPHQKSNPE
jgi:tRNA/rRNA methyltransferase